MATHGCIFFWSVFWRRLNRALFKRVVAISTAKYADALMLTSLRHMGCDAAPHVGCCMVFVHSLVVSVWAVWHQV